MTWRKATGGQKVKGKKYNTCNKEGRCRPTLDSACERDSVTPRETHETLSSARNVSESLPSLVADKAVALKARKLFLLSRQLLRVEKVSNGEERLFRQGEENLENEHALQVFSIEIERCISILFLALVTGNTINAGC